VFGYVLGQHFDAVRQPLEYRIRVMPWMEDQLYVVRGEIEGWSDFTYMTDLGEQHGQSARQNGQQVGSRHDERRRQRVRRRHCEVTLHAMRIEDLVEIIRSRDTDM
jgi:hypothetical protein